MGLNCTCNAISWSNIGNFLNVGALLLILKGYCAEINGLWIFRVVMVHFGFTHIGSPFLFALSWLIILVLCSKNTWEIALKQVIHEVFLYKLVLW